MMVKNSQLMAERNSQLMAEQNSQLMAERIYAHDKIELTIFGHTDLRISLSGAKFDEEADFDVRSTVGPPKPHQVEENLTFRSENFARNFFRRKIESCKSSETRVAEDSRRWVLSSRDERLLEVCHRRPSFVRCPSCGSKNLTLL